MLRLFTPLFVVLATLVAAPAFATAKNPGAYISIAVRNADACARACADDGLCMAWSFYADGACELAATVPAASPQGAAAFALAARAPRLTPIAASHEPAAPQGQTPAVVAEEAPTVVAIAEVDADLVLLGGPEEEGDLRTRLPGRP